MAEEYVSKETHDNEAGTNAVTGLERQPNRGRMAKRATIYPSLITKHAALRINPAFCYIVFISVASEKSTFAQ